MTGREDGKPLKIAAAARAAGVRVQTLHYYERRGLLHPDRSGNAGYRSYGQADVALVRAVKRAQGLGFSLAEIETLLRIGDGADPIATRSLAVVKLAELDEKLRDLRRIRDALGALLETCDCGGTLARCNLFEGLGADVTESVP